MLTIADILKSQLKQCANFPLYCFAILDLDPNATVVSDSAAVTLYCGRAGAYSARDLKTCFVIVSLVVSSRT